MRFGFAATAPFGADVLERLLARGHEIPFLLTTPDRPRGRGRKTAPPPAKEIAELRGVPVLQPERLTDDLDLPADTIVIAAYGRIVPTALLERALWLNVHPSLLPRWRGAAPVERALMAGDVETGVTIHQTTPDLDAGPIAAQRAFPILPEDNAGTVFVKAADLGVALLEEVLPEPTFTPQPSAGATYADKLTAADRELDWSAPPEQIVARVRALAPHIGARTELHGRRVTVWRAAIDNGRAVPVEVQPEGGRRMAYEAWLRGLR